MISIDRIEAFICGRKVGTLASAGRGIISFEYSDDWLDSGYSISPFSLPLHKKLYMPQDREMEGLFGVFQDTLSDGWGRLLTDRYLRSKGHDPSRISPLIRLAMASKTSLGALEYRPKMTEASNSTPDDFDLLTQIADRILDESNVSESEMDCMYAKGGSSGGARPKIDAIIDGELWIVKLPTSMDGIDAGSKEFECSRRALDAGIDMADSRLLPSRSTKGFFASRRFDRIGGKRIHMVTLSGLLESSHRFPSLDYEHLLKTTMILTKDAKAVAEAFRRACFNVFLGNQDDHGRNFAFLFDDSDRRWRLSPAYDITVSRTYFGEHSTTVMGKGRDIGKDDLRKLADMFSLDEIVREEIIRDTESACR